MALGGEFSPAIHVNVASPAGGYTVGTPAFFHYILRLSEFDMPLSGDDREAVDGVIIRAEAAGLPISLSYVA